MGDTLSPYRSPGHVAMCISDRQTAGELPLTLYYTDGGDCLNRHIHRSIVAVLGEYFSWYLKREVSCSLVDYTEHLVNADGNLLLPITSDSFDKKIPPKHFEIYVEGLHLLTLKPSNE